MSPPVSWAMANTGAVVRPLEGSAPWLREVLWAMGYDDDGDGASYTEVGSWSDTTSTCPEAESAGDGAPLQTGVATVAKPCPVLDLGVPRREHIDSDGEQVIADPMWINHSDGDGRATFDRAPGGRLALSAGQRGSSSEAMPDGHAMTEGQAANPQNLVPVAEGSDRGSDSPRGATAAEGSDRGFATGWWGTDYDPFAAFQFTSWAERSDSFQAERSDFSQGAPEDIPTLLAGYWTALCHAQEAVSNADSATTCVVLKSLLRQVRQALDSVDECQCYAAVALVAIEAAVARSEVSMLALMKLAECRVRDLLAWRAQKCAPLGDRAMYLATVRHMYVDIGLEVNDRSIAKILHAHRKEVARLLVGSFLSETQRQSRARGGKVRAARNRPMPHRSMPQIPITRTSDGRQIFVV